MDVKAAVLNKVMDYCKHYVDSKMPDIEKVRDNKKTTTSSRYVFALSAVSQAWPS